MLNPTAPRHSKLICAFALPGLLALSVSGLAFQPAHAEKYQSRLNSLILKKNDVYLPPRLVLGEEARFVIKAPPGSHVKLLLSAQNSGYKLPNGTELRVGAQSEELTGVVPENGVLQLQMVMPKDPDAEGKLVYIDAVYGTSDDDLAPMELVDATGRRTGNNALAIVKPSDAGGMSILPNMPGVSPQMMNQITNLTNLQGDSKQLIDNGDIDQNRQSDRNPFVYRGGQAGLGGTR
jgi:hypothetical protein